MTPDVLATLQQHLLQCLAAPPSEVRRLLHGRGRCWPGLEQLTVDWLQGTLLVCLYRDPGAAALAALQDSLHALTRQPQWASSGAERLLLQLRYLADSPALWLHGTPVQQCQVSEQGLHYLLDLGSKQNNGLFLDMRLGRQWVREQAAGRRVLNLFAYTCGFSVAALAGGAQQVVNLDMARAALSRGRDNHRLNGQPLERVSFLGHELFRSWGKLRKLGPYDLIIIDPPSLQKGSFVLSQDYPRVLRRLPELLAPQGLVLACVNAPEVGTEFLLHSMVEAAPSLQFVQRLDNPPEFADRDPQCALKAMVFQAPAAQG